MHFAAGVKTWRVVRLSASGHSLMQAKTSGVLMCSSSRESTCSFFPDRMTGQNYLEFLQNGLPKQLEGVPLATRIAMYFQHDGSPSHYNPSCDATSQLHFP